MATFACSYCALLLAMEKFEKKRAAAESQAVPAVTAVVCLLPFGISLAPQTSQAYHEAALHHGFHYIQRWQWYEWLGIVAPLILFGGFRRIARKREWGELDARCPALLIVNLICFQQAQ